MSASAEQATGAARRLLDLGTSDAMRIEKLGRAAVSALAIHRALQRQPIATAASLAKATRLTAATVNKSLAHLERLRVVEELTSKQRGRVFGYARYVDILNEGMALPDEGGAAMSQFAFLQAEWPAVFDSAGRAEAAVLRTQTICRF